MDCLGVGLVIVLLVIIFVAVVFFSHCIASSEAERMAKESEVKKMEPKLNPPSEGNYYTSKQDSLLTDEELQQMDEMGWVMVNIISESYHDYLGCYPEAPMITGTRYIYVFRREKKAE